MNRKSVCADRYKVQILNEDTVGIEVVISNSVPMNIVCKVAPSSPQMKLETASLF